MSGRFFLDTNVFVYTFDRKAPAKARRAIELVREAVATRRGIVSYQVVQEFFNVALRRFEQPLGISEAEQYLSTVFAPLLAIHSSQSLLADALRLCPRHGLSWYDSLIVAAAVEGQCATLYSEDLQHGRTYAGTKIENPFL